MASITTTIYSEFSVKKLCFIFANGDYGEAACIGNFEEEMECKTVSKKCCGVSAWNGTYGTGAGTAKVTAHMPFALYYKLHDMEKATLASGVHGYGYNSTHPQVALTADVYDELGTEKLKAYPCATISTGPVRNVENGAEEVAEVELSIAFAPDANGFGVYEAFSADVTTAIKNSWMTAFQPSLVAAATVMGVASTVATVTKGSNTTVAVTNASGTPVVRVTQVGSGVTASYSSNTLTISASASAAVGEATVTIEDEAGAKADIRVTVVASA